MIQLGKNSFIEDRDTLDMQFGTQSIIGKRSKIRFEAIMAPCRRVKKLRNDRGLTHYSVVNGHSGLTVEYFG